MLSQCIGLKISISNVHLVISTRENLWDNVWQSSVVFFIVTKFSRGYNFGQDRGNHYQVHLNLQKARLGHLTIRCDYGDNSLLFI